MNIPISIEPVSVLPKEFASYREFGGEVYEAVRQRARLLSGRSILHINSTEKGGGVAELLKSQVALERDLGLNSSWLVIRPQSRFFDVTKKIHNLLQGRLGELLPEERELYESESRRLSCALEEYLQNNPTDAIVAHDPQPLLAVALGAKNTPKALRIHIDTCQPNPDALSWLCGMVSSFDRTIISLAQCVPWCFSADSVSTILPAIDPLAPKNVPMPISQAKAVLRAFGIDPERKLITQVSRLEPWKQPIEVIEAYHQVKDKYSDIQLVLVGFTAADDDPEALSYLKEVQKAAGEDLDIHIYHDKEDLVRRNVDNDTFINALQTASDVVVQFSLREGFGLTVTEPMWKGRPVVAGDVGGIKLQIKHRENGMLVNTINELSSTIIELLGNPELAKQLGAAALESVKADFLTPRYLLQHLEVYQKLLIKGKDN